VLALLGAGEEERCKLGGAKASGVWPNPVSPVIKAVDPVDEAV